MAASSYPIYASALGAGVVNPVGPLHVQINGSSNALVVGSNACVGIGKSNPAYALDVAGDINFSGTFRSNALPYVSSQFLTVSGSNITLASGNSLGIGIATPSGPLQVMGQGASASNAIGLFVASNAFVGHGTSNPTQALDVTGSLSATYISAANMGPRNRLVNGDMRVDQRATAAAPVVTGSMTASAAATNYTTDRWQASTGPASGSLVAQQVSLSTADQVATGGLPKAVMLSQVPMNGLTTYIPFDGSSAADVMGGVGAATVVGTSYSSSCKVGKTCIDFTGNTVGATTATNSITYPVSVTPTLPITVSYWIYVTNPGTIQQIWTFGTGVLGDGTNRGLGHFIYNNSQLVTDLYINGVDKGAGDGVTAASLSANTWTHICSTIGVDGLLNTYINGTFVYKNTAQTSGVLNCFNGSNVNTLWLGARNTTDYNIAFKGLIDDFRIYNRALSAAEIAALAGNVGIPPVLPTATTDITTYSSRLTFDSTASDAMSALAAPTAVGGAATYNTSSYKAGSASLDLTTNTPYGTIKSLTYTPSSTSAPMTVSFWINPTSSANNAHYQVPLCFGSSTATGYDIVLNSSNQLFIESYLGSLASTLPSSATYIPSGGWSYVVATLVSGGASSLYINGTLAASVTVATGTTLANTGKMIVGRNINVDMNVGYTPVFSVTGHSSGYAWANSTNRPTFDPYNNQVTFTAASTQHLNAGSQTYTMATTGFTASFAVIFTAASGINYERVFDFCPSAGSSTNSITIVRNGTGNQLDAYFWIGSGGISAVVSAPITQNTLQILTVTISSTGVMTMYKNGSVVSNQQTSAPTTRTLAQSYVGRSSDGGAGICSDMRLFYFAAYNATFSMSEVWNQHTLFASTLFGRINTIPAALTGLTPTSNLYPLTPVIEVTPTMSGASWANATNRPTFNTTNNYISFNSASSQYLDAGAKTFNTQTNGFSATAVFMQTGTPGGADRIFDFGSGAPSNNIIMYRGLFTTFNGTTRNGLVSQPVYVQNKLQFITVTMTAAGAITIYENGVSTATASVSAMTGPRTFANTYIGRSLFAGDAYANMNLYYFAAYDGTLSSAQVLTQYQTLSGLIRPEWGQFAYTGLIDDVRLYNTALSASQISGMYSPLLANLTFDNTTADAMGTLSAPTVTGTLAYSPNCKVGTACLNLLANPVTGAPNVYLTYACAAPPNRCTVSLWMYVNSISGSGQQVVYGFGTATQYSWAMAVNNSASGQIYTNMPMGTVGGSQADYTITTTAYAVAGTWMHFVNTVDASTGQNVIYVNGVRVGSRSDIPAGAVFVGSDATAVTGFKLGGAYQSTTVNSFQGLIDDFRIYNTALTPAQVAGLYYSSPNTGYVLYQQPIEGLNFADMAWGTSAAQPATVSAWIKNNSAASNAQALTLAVNNGNQGLTAWFPFENGSAVDVMGGVTGPAVTGTLALSSSTYKVGSSALNLTANTAGSTATAYVSYTNTNLNITTAMTVSFWMYISALPASNYITPICFGSSYTYDICITGPGYIYSDLNVGGTYTSTTVSGVPALSTGTWIHVCGTVAVNTTGGNIIYVNGVKYSSADVGAGNIVTGNLRIGSRGDNSFGFKGYLDDFRIYNKVLTPAQIQQLYLNNASSTALTPYLTPRSVLYQTPSLPANAWSRVSVTLPGDIAGTWAADNTLGLNLALCLGAGANYASSNLAAASGNSSNVWQNALVYTASNQVFGASNAFLGSLGNSLLLTGVQLERGQAASPYEFKPLPAELAAAQRYYETSYDQDTAVGTATNAGAVAWAVVASNRPSYHVAYKTPKRSPPSITLYNPATANTTGLRNIGSSSSGAGTLEASGTTGFRVYWPSGNTGQVVGDTISGHFVANAEL
jgi:hypothetical protein